MEQKERNRIGKKSDSKFIGKCSFLKKKILEFDFSGMLTFVVNSTPFILEIYYDLELERKHLKWRETLVEKFDFQWERDSIHLSKSEQADPKLPVSGSLQLPTKDEIIRTLYKCAKIEKTDEGIKMERIFEKEAESILSLITGNDR